MQGQTRAKPQWTRSRNQFIECSWRLMNPSVEGASRPSALQYGNETGHFLCRQAAQFYLFTKDLQGVKLTPWAETIHSHLRAVCSPKSNCMFMDCGRKRDYLEEVGRTCKCYLGLSWNQIQNPFVKRCAPVPPLVLIYLAVHTETFFRCFKDGSVRVWRKVK